MSGWVHYEDLPFEVVTVQTNEEGKTVTEELVRRHSVWSEAVRTRASNEASLVEPKRFRVELRDLRGHPGLRKR
jgi:hypothetical protein